jgi:hypothetical protein
MGRKPISFFGGGDGLGGGREKYEGRRMNDEVQQWIIPWLA